MKDERFDQLYSTLVNKYYQLEKELREIEKENADVSARWNAKRDEMSSVLTILRMYGKQVYEHFEAEPIKESEEE